ncbi:MAG: hypothetical protein IT260_16450 [Saprospiraceae bacterium]|nr:hypothetical protein [Saprospiraceae bacterium]
MKKLWNRLIRMFSPGGSWFATLGESEFETQAIVLKKYPCPPATVFPDARIPASAITEVWTNSSPPALRMGEELLFVPAEKKAELLSFALLHNIPVTDRHSNWEWIAAPFLDTETTAEDLARYQDLLAQQGLDAAEVAQLRREIEAAMLAYNFDTMHWEWVSLGLWDVLVALQARYDPAEFAEFYWRAMAVELRQKS